MGSLLSEMSSHSLVLMVLNKPRWWSLIIKVPRVAKRERMSLPRPAVYWPLPRMKHYGVNKQQIKKQGLQTVWVKPSSTLALYRHCLSHDLCNKDISGEEWTGLIYWGFPCKHVSCQSHRFITSCNDNPNPQPTERQLGAKLLKCWLSHRVVPFMGSSVTW